MGFLWPLISKTLHMKLSYSVAKCERKPVTIQPQGTRQRNKQNACFLARVQESNKVSQDMVAEYIFKSITCYLSLNFCDQVSHKASFQSIIFFIHHSISKLINLKCMLSKCRLIHITQTTERFKSPSNLEIYVSQNISIIPRNKQRSIFYLHVLCILI